jgi:hypothetical protein
LSGRIYTYFVKKLTAFGIFLSSTFAIRERILCDDVRIENPEWTFDLAEEICG